MMTLHHFLRGNLRRMHFVVSSILHLIQMDTLVMAHEPIGPPRPLSPGGFRCAGTLILLSVSAHQGSR